MRHKELRWRCWPVWVSVTCAMAPGALMGDQPETAAQSGPSAAVASLSLVKHTVQIGQPIWADFSICNPTDDPMILKLDNSPDEEPIQSTVLPLAHVFSGPGPRSVGIVSAADNSAEDWATLSGLPSDAPAVRIDAHGIVGVRVNLAEYYPGLLRSGTFYLTWKPYGAKIVSDRIKLTITQLKQAVIETAYGEMTIAFEYEVAPKHVANFIELAENGFYNNKTFHMIVPGALVHGGCPRGDGTGVRPDGMMLKAEFSEKPHRAGTVSMSRKANDPDSASCQFFICMTRLRELDGRYTVFGQLVGQESFDTLQRISQVPTDDHDRPIEPVYIRSIRIENAPAGRQDRTRTSRR